MPQSNKNRNLFLMSGIAAPTRRLWLDGAARDARYMGEWQKLTAEAATLEKLVQVHRLQHRRTGYFARVLDVRRGVRAVLGKGAHLAQVEQALHAIRAAWKDLQSLLIQLVFPLVCSEEPVTPRAPVRVGCRVQQRVQFSCRTDFAFSGESPFAFCSWSGGMSEGGATGRRSALTGIKNCELRTSSRLWRSLRTLDGAASNCRSLKCSSSCCASMAALSRF